MSQYNKFILEGNLTRDPEVFEKDDKKVTRFAIANNSGFGDKATPLFMDCAAFGRTGEIIAQHFTKGQGIQVDGQLKSRTYEDKDGNKRTAYQIDVQNFVFRGKPREKTEEEPKY